MPLVRDYVANTVSRELLFLVIKASEGGSGWRFPSNRGASRMLKRFLCYFISVIAFASVFGDLFKVGGFRVLFRRLFS